jgi:hypothetical protein
MPAIPQESAHMQDALQTVDLRPLSIGEIFDRAITLLVRNWIPFGILAAVGVLPRQVCQFLAITQSPDWNVAAFIALFLVPVAGVAAAAVVAQIYRKQDVDWRSAFLIGLQKLPGAIGVGIMTFLVFVIPLLIVVGIPVGTGLFRFPNFLADIVAIPVIVAAAAVIAAYYVCGAYAYAGMGIDDLGASDAVTRALSLLHPQHLLRNLLFALALATIGLGGPALGGALLGFTAVAFHSIAIGSALLALIVVIAGMLGNVLAAVFYFDVAVRREGYDMQAALDAMSTA